MPGAVSPDRVLKELSELWVSLGKEGKSESGDGVLRACSMTLVVLAEMSDDPVALGETMALLMPEHPARAILVRLRGEGDPAIDARVYSQCWMPFGIRRQICCEQIEITASDAALRDLAPFVLALAAADLPLILWCRSARLVERVEFWNLARLARKVIVDSAQFGDPAAGIERVAEGIRSGFRVGDLSWARLTRWRESLAQAFENRQYLALLPKVTAVRIVYGSDQQAPALYFHQWLDGALKAAGAAASIEMSAGESPSVELSGEGIHVKQTADEGPLVITVNGLSRCTNFPRPLDHLTMREELRILQRDPVFEGTLP